MITPSWLRLLYRQHSEVSFGDVTGGQVSCALQPLYIRVLMCFLHVKTC